MSTALFFHPDALTDLFISWRMPFRPTICIFYHHAPYSLPPPFLSFLFSSSSSSSSSSSYAILLTSSGRMMDPTAIHSAEVAAALTSIRKSFQQYSTHLIPVELSGTRCRHRCYKKLTYDLMLISFKEFILWIADSQWNVCTIPVILNRTLDWIAINSSDVFDSFKVNCILI